MDTLRKITHTYLVRVVPKLDYFDDHLCDACMYGKQTKTFFHSTPNNFTTIPFEILHMDMFRPINTTNLEGKPYGLVIIDNYIRFTWVKFLKLITKEFSEFKIFFAKIQMKNRVFHRFYS